MNERLSEDIRRLIDGELDPDDVPRVLREAADDPEARSLLHMEFALRSSFENNHAGSVPDGFADRVMDRVRQRPVVAVAREQSRPAWTERLSELLDVLVAPRPVMLRPAYALAAVLVLGVAVVVLADAPSAPQEFAADSAERGPLQQAADVTSEEVLVRFVYMSTGASSVAVAGDFNDWEPQPMRPRTVSGHRVWSTTLRLSQGEHQYMFVIDGERWVTDPLAPVQRQDGFGHKNAVITL